MPRMLILGDGNFSYTVEFLKQQDQYERSRGGKEILAKRPKTRSIKPVYEVIATEYETKASLDKDPEFRKNYRILSGKKTPMYFGVDATNLQKYPELNRGFERVQFNFPYVKGASWKTDYKNRELIAKAFRSVSQKQKIGDAFHISIPKYSGIKKDGKRRYQEIWRLRVMFNIPESAAQYGYRYQKKRKTEEYSHRKTGKNESADAAKDGRELIFIKDQDTPILSHPPFTARFSVGNLPPFMFPNVLTDTTSSNEERQSLSAEQQSALLNHPDFEKQFAFYINQGYVKDVGALLLNDNSAGYARQAQHIAVIPALGPKFSEVHAERINEVLRYLPRLKTDVYRSLMTLVENNAFCNGKLEPRGRVLRSILSVCFVLEERQVDCKPLLREIKKKVSQLTHNQIERLYVGFAIEPVIDSLKVKTMYALWNIAEHRITEVFKRLSMVQALMSCSSFFRKNPYAGLEMEVLNALNKRNLNQVDLKLVKDKIILMYLQDKKKEDAKALLIDALRDKGQVKGWADFIQRYRGVSSLGELLIEVVSQSLDRYWFFDGGGKVLLGLQDGFAMPHAEYLIGKRRPIDLSDHEYRAIDNWLTSDCLASFTNFSSVKAVSYILSTMVKEVSKTVSKKTDENDKKYQRREYLSFLTRLEVWLDKALVNGFPAPETNAYVIREVLSVCQVLAINDPKSSVALIEKIQSYHQNESSAALYADWLVEPIQALWTLEKIEDAYRGCHDAQVSLGEKLPFLNNLGLGENKLHEIVCAVNHSWGKILEFKDREVSSVSEGLNEIFLGLYLKQLKEKDEKNFNQQVKQMLHKEWGVEVTVRSLLKLKIISYQKMGKLLASILESHPHDTWIRKGIKAMKYLKDGFSARLSELVLQHFRRSTPYLNESLYLLLSTLFQSRLNVLTHKRCLKMLEVLKGEAPGYQDKCEVVLASLCYMQDEGSDSEAVSQVASVS